MTLIKDVSNDQILETVWIKHLSYSSMKCYMEDLAEFKKWYIDWNRDEKKTNPSLIIGSAVHFGIEALWRQVKETITEERWLHLKDLNKKDPSSAREYWNWYLIDIVKEHKLDIEVEKFVREAVKTAEKEWNMRFWKTQDLDSSIFEAILSFKWYVVEAPFYFPIMIEGTEKFEFYDENDNQMPIPIKTKIDLICKNIDDEICVVDHKTVSKWYEKNVNDYYPDFDIQAWTYYLGCFSALGEQPKKIIFDQIFKGKLSDFQTYIKKDELIAMCEKWGVEYDPKDTMDKLKDKLLASWVVKPAQRLLPYVIDIEKDQRPIDVFYKVYECIVIDLYYKQLFNIPFLVNPFKAFGWQEIYKHWIK